MHTLDCRRGVVLSLPDTHSRSLPDESPERNYHWGILCGERDSGTPCRTGDLPVSTDPGTPPSTPVRLPLTPGRATSHPVPAGVEGRAFEEGKEVSGW